jgi:hypothetical protein
MIGKVILAYRFPSPSGSTSAGGKIPAVAAVVLSVSPNTRWLVLVSVAGCQDAGDLVWRVVLLSGTPSSW